MKDYARGGKEEEMRAEVGFAYILLLEGIISKPHGKIRLWP